MKNIRKYLIGLSIAALLIIVLAVFLINSEHAEKAKDDVEKKPLVDKEKRPVRTEKTRKAQQQKTEMPPDHDVHEEQQPASVEPEGGGKISGIVVTKGGELIENACIVAAVYVPRFGRDRPVKGANIPRDYSDSDGAFELMSLEEEGMYDLKVTAEGYAETYGEDIPVGSSNVKIVMAQEAAISGRIFSEETKEPLEGANIRLNNTYRPSYRGFKAREITSDVDGEYIFKGLPAAKTYVVEAMTKSLLSDPVYVELEDEELKKDVDLYLYPALTISGKVVLMGTTIPVADLKLEIFRPSSPGVKYGIRAEATSDTEGNFIFRGLRRRGYILKTAWKSLYRIVSPNSRRLDNLQTKGMSFVPTYNLSLNKEDLFDSIIVEVEGRRSIYGKITNDYGEPVKGVRVRPSKSDPYFTIGQAADSKKDGSYEIVNLPTEIDSFTFRFDHDQYERVEKLVEFQQDQLDKLLDVVLKQGLTISGYITDSDSQPIKGATVQAWHSKSGDQIERKTTSSDTEGFYSISGIRAGKWVITTEKGGYIKTKKGGIQVEDESLTGIDLTLPKGFSLSGRVFLGKDIPLESAWVSFDFQSKMHSLSCGVETNREGRFIIHGLKQGVYERVDITSSYQITEHGGMPQERLRLNERLENVIVGKDDLIIRLDVFGSISGRIQDAITMVPITDFTIEILKRNNKRYMGRVPQFFSGSTDGAFIIEWMPPGTFKLLVNAKGYARKTFDVPVKANEAVTGLVISLEKADR